MQFIIFPDSLSCASWCNSESAHSVKRPYILFADCGIYGQWVIQMIQIIFTFRGVLAWFDSDDSAAVHELQEQKRRFPSVEAVRVPWLQSSRGCLCRTSEHQKEGASESYHRMDREGKSYHQQNFAYLSVTWSWYLQLTGPTSLFPGHVGYILRIILIIVFGVCQLWPRLSNASDRSMTRFLIHFECVSGSKFKADYISAGRARSVMRYRALNTFIDDLFAFIIKMPTMHRISVPQTVSGLANASSSTLVCSPPAFQAALLQAEL